MLVRNPADRRTSEELPRLSWSEKRYGAAMAHYSPAFKRPVLQLAAMSNL
jgi:hypothetical protein